MTRIKKIIKYAGKRENIEKFNKVKATLAKKFIDKSLQDFPVLKYFPGITFALSLNSEVEMLCSTFL